MPDPAALLNDLLACPRCGQDLDDRTCRACDVSFPDYGGVPWLFADPSAAVSDWRNRWQLAQARLREDLGRVTEALRGELLAATRTRLEALAAGYRAQTDHLDRILAPMARAAGGSLETLLALRTRLPPGQDIVSYTANVFRDWSWGDEECRHAADAVVAALDGDGPRRILVLGSGAGRLAYDLHQRTEADLTVAVDFNPLLCYTGHAVAAGGTLRLVEFPLAPADPASAAIERTLTAPAPSRAGLAFVMADVMRGPFRPGSFDLVVTPWLLDVLGEPAGDVLARINGLLTDGGRWIHHGSVAFDGPDPAERLTLPELEETAALRGFASLRSSETWMPYMACPDSRHARREQVVTLSGIRTAPAELTGRHRSLPDWIVEGRSPVPALPAFRTQAMTTRMHAFLMSLIDGQRSLKDMARVLEEQQLMPRREAETALRGFLIKMHDEARSGGSPRT